MNKNCVWGGQVHYESPAMTSIEVRSEHVLCTSGFTTENEDYFVIGGSEGENWI